jgi:hypothetical protein
MEGGREVGTPDALVLGGDALVSTVMSRSFRSQDGWVQDPVPKNGRTELTRFPRWPRQTSSSLPLLPTICPVRSGAAGWVR